jgi:serine/threonine protein kinase/tetratricopeptide (TPR) repeat protein
MSDFPHAGLQRDQPPTTRRLPCLALLDDQNRRWQEGRGVPVEDYLEQTPGLGADPDGLLDLIYNEYRLREEHGHSPDPEEYLRRFPDLAGLLRVQFEVHRAMRPGEVLDELSVADGAGVTVEGPTSLPVVDGYEVLGELGRGAMGVVYEARQLRLNRPVALKMILAGPHAGRRERVRFETEARAVARLQHPHIVQIHEIGEQDGRPYVSLELVRGGNLAQRLAGKPLVPRQAAELAELLARAVHHAHEAGILHRDLKPANVLLARSDARRGVRLGGGEGAGYFEPKITDFGLAKLLDQEGTASASGAPGTAGPLGTPPYMAPEQAGLTAKGDPRKVGGADRATDVYALGVILYEMLTGRPPFIAATVYETLQQVCSLDAVPPRKLQPGCPRDLETICLACLHKEPGRRYASAADLADDLRRFLHSEPVRARRTSALERVWMWCRRRPTLAALAAVLVLAVWGGAIAFGVQQHRERQRVEGVRTELARLVREGREALDQNDPQLAEQRFLNALALVHDEPALHEQELGVAGWLDHSRRQGEQERWRKRRPPPLFEEWRDEALVWCALPGPSRKRSAAAAREAIGAARELTVADDPAWRGERAQLSLLEADLALREGDPAGALRTLDETRGEGFRLWHVRRAECLDRLGRREEAEQERGAADRDAPQDVLAAFLGGLDRMQRGDAGGAVADFDRVLALEPDHFLARFFQAACFLRSGRLGEARVALTACLGQRPHFAWTCLLLARVHANSNDPAAALRELQRGLDQQPRPAARVALLGDRGYLRLRGEEWEAARADFDEALRLQPDAPGARLGRGLAAAARGDCRAALPDAEQEDALDDPELLARRAGLFARAAGLVGDDLKTRYLGRAVADLRAALDRLPEADRRKYWSETVLPDVNLRPLGDLPGFRKLAPGNRE